jgi:tetratricopeptide (TPR) repeat protein
LYLREFVVAARPRGTAGPFRAVRWKTAWADQLVAIPDVEDTPTRYISQAIDGDPNTSWTSYPRCQAPRWAVFVPAEPTGPEGGSVLKITLAGGGAVRYPDANLGRFRVSVRTQAYPWWVEELASASWAGLNGWTRLALARALRKEWQPALDALAKAAVTASDGRLVDHLLFFPLYEQLGQQDQARQALKRALARMAHSPSEEAPPHPGEDSALRFALKCLDRGLQQFPQDAELLAHRARVQTQLGRPEAAEEDYQKLQEVEPGNAAWPRHLREAQAERNARRGDWGAAAALYSQVTASEDASLEDWQRYALLLLARGEKASYQELCAQLLGRFGMSEDPHVAGTVAWICALAPAAVADSRRPVLLAARAAAKEPKSFRAARSHGAALLRAAQLEAAGKELSRARAMRESPETQLLWTLFLFHHGRTQEAQSGLAQCRQVLDQAQKKPDTPAGEDQLVWNRLPWSERVVLLLLRSEAEALIDSGRADSGK